MKLTDIINLTPHALNVQSEEGGTVAIPASGQVARVVPTAKPEVLPPLVVEGEDHRFCPECVGNLQDMESCGTCGGAGSIPLTFSIPRVRDPKRLPMLSFLPEPDGEKVYIVSRPVRDLLDRLSDPGEDYRPDVWSPGELIRSAPTLPPAVTLLEGYLHGEDGRVCDMLAALEQIKALLLANAGQPRGCKGIRQ